MNHEHALDAGVLAFVQCQSDLALRETIERAITAYDTALRQCAACRGSATLVQRDSTVYKAEGLRAARQPVADGDEMCCVACGGSGVDLANVAWTCQVDGYDCRHDQTREPGHAGCGWAREPKPPGSSAIDARATGP